MRADLKTVQQTICHLPLQLVVLPAHLPRGAVTLQSRRTVSVESRVD